MYKSSTFAFIVAIGLFVGVCITITVLTLRSKREVATFTTTEVASTPTPTPPAVEPKIEEPINQPIPAEAQLEVPFYVQAPYARWDEIHKETCEEASLLMVRSYKEKLPTYSIEELDRELVSFVEWQTLNGYAYDVTVRELKDAAEGKYNFKGAEIIMNPTIDQIKQEIANGNPVIVPAAGRLLPNPYFTPPGPRYHMLVVIGYDSDEFITHDPGTRRGEKFRYTFSALMNAIHNYTAGDITTGTRAILVYR